MRPSFTLSAISIMLLTACEPTPQLARDLPSDNTYLAFNQRLNARFPIGSPSGALIEELEREHFEINTFEEQVAKQRRNDPQFARVAEQAIRGNLGSYDFYSWRTALQGACSNSWSVYYSIKNDRVAALHGDLRLGGCL